MSQTPVGGFTPNESEMFLNFLDQVKAADELGFEIAWVAESHLSSEVQKSHKNPVIPHWSGEVGLNTDILQLAARVFSTCKRIEVGSAVMNILCNGGPIAHAERIATFLTWHGLNPEERRKIHVGFAAGRFEYMNRAFGIGPRNELEERLWPILKGKVFAQGAELFVRLLNGEILASQDLPPLLVSRSDLRDTSEWTYGSSESLAFPSFWNFEPLQIIPKEFRRDLLNLVVGSHDPKVQNRLNTIAPVQVFNLSITSEKVITETHDRMKSAYHREGGPWQRSFMPRTVFVFINDKESLTLAERAREARLEAEQALSAYWSAMEGTVDPIKIKNASENALIGNAEEIAQQIQRRFHKDDRLMLWFDFFNHDSPRVINNMRAFQNKVVPILRKAGF